MTTDSGARQYAASLIRRYFEGTVTFDLLIENFADSLDPLIQAAVDIVLHQPRRGFAGVSEGHWNAVYWPRVQQVLEELDKGEAGIAPASRLYPILSPLKLAGFLLLGVIAAGTSGGHWIKVWHRATGLKPLNEWELLLEIAAGTILATCAVLGFRGFLYRVHLYRSGPPGSARHAA